MKHIKHTILMVIVWNLEKLQNDIKKTKLGSPRKILLIIFFSPNSRKVALQKMYEAVYVDHGRKGRTACTFRQGP